MPLHIRQMVLAIKRGHHIKIERLVVTNAIFTKQGSSPGCFLSVEAFQNTRREIAILLYHGATACHYSSEAVSGD